MDNYEKLIKCIEDSSATQAPAVLSMALVNALEKQSFNGHFGLISMMTRLLNRGFKCQRDEQHYSYSTNGELYYGRFDTWEKAVAEGVAGGESFWVGRYVAASEGARVRFSQQS